MSRSVLPVFLSALISVGTIPIAFAATSEPQLNFKIYSPEPASATPPAETTPEAAPALTTGADNIIPAMEAGSTAAITPTPEADASATAPASMEPATAPEIKTTSAEATPVETPPAETPAAVTPVVETPAAVTPVVETPASILTPSATNTTPDVPLRSETPEAVPTPTAATTTTPDVPLRTEAPVEAAPAKAAEVETTGTTPMASETPTAAPAAEGQSSGDATAAAAAAKDDGTEKTADNKTLQGYIRVVPSGTKIPIIMDTAVDSETSQEGDEFTARTSEDLNIDGGVAVPAGSIIKGRIAQLNAPKHLDRSGSVALKFDTVTTPDNRQIPLVANLVAHGGVVHAKRGLKDIAIDSSTVAVPFVLGLGIGALAGNSKNSSTSSSTSTSKISKGEAAAIGAAIGLVVGVAILCAKKGKKVDVRPGDELKIELAEDLRMPMM